jgi:hypothetical protein
MKRAIHKQPGGPTRRDMEDKLDHALEDSFPASDPVSFIQPSPPELSVEKSKASSRKKSKRAS